MGPGASLTAHHVPCSEVTPFLSRVGGEGFLSPLGGLSLPLRLPGEGQEPEAAAAQGAASPCEEAAIWGMERKTEERRWPHQEG